MMPKSPPEAARPGRTTRLTKALILGIVWLAFGSAFVGVKVGVATVPPLLFAGPRFIIAGAALLGWSAWRGGGRIDLRRREVAGSALVGAALILGGQGGVSWASQTLAPGVVAVLASTVPLWVALLGRVVLGTRIPGLALVGLILGFAGVVFLASPSAGAGVQLLPALVVTVGAISWAGGSLLGGRVGIGRRPLASAGVQMLVGGVLQVAAGVAMGEPGRLHLGAVGAHAVIAFVVLLLATSLLGFTLFAWLLANTSASFANTQAYAAPVVALLLGHIILGELLTARALLAAATVLAGVALIVAATGRAQRSGRELRTPIDAEDVPATA